MPRLKSATYNTVIDGVKTTEKGSVDSAEIILHESDREEKKGKRYLQCLIRQKRQVQS
jgi:hypothetical protein